MEREMSAAPDWMVQQMRKKRVRCNALECSAASAPAWKTETDSQGMPHGPEVSYGIPFRWSASRLLASDMRSVLCSALNGSNSTATGSAKRGYHNDTGRCDALLSMPAWTVDGFVRSYSDSTFASLLHSSLRTLLPARSELEVPPSLLEMHMHMAGTEASASYAARNVMQRIDDGSMLWDGPDAPDWVACHQRNKTCYGKVSKADWYSPTRRAGACKAAFSEQVKKGLVNSTAVGLDVCNLNGRTNSMCEVLCLFYTITQCVLYNAMYYAG
jgi:hypothetical protein